MASTQFIAFSVVTIILPTLTMAAEHIVRDDKGWTANFNYTTWASGKVFRVGDTLVFKYQPPHNIYKVDGNGFKNCVASGKKWYVYGFGKHCSELGQKLVINVEAEAPAPTPIPNAANGFAASGYQIIVASVAGMIMI
ncbi:BLUE COPPER PROTEIN [Salix koriyanagi]|uniref:BLUE COPPER PROTEIN n=1 Tax=Salix koriyanagi TaxID=2511006 RepID=A0A9Q0W1D2_9ROSI|nr:BLUE COPPER PROTEIN [Salix koriyanagi]